MAVQVAQAQRDPAHAWPLSPVSPQGAESMWGCVSVGGGVSFVICLSGGKPFSNVLTLKACLFVIHIR